MLKRLVGSPVPRKVRWREGWGVNSPQHFKKKVLGYKYWGKEFMTPLRKRERKIQKKEKLNIF